MSRVRLIHWNAPEARARADELRQLGHAVDSRPPAMPNLLRELAASPPAAIVIDLSRVPSHGREIGIALRQRKGTRFIPLVFAGGDPDKVARVRGLLPDATYAQWKGIAAALRRAIAHPPLEPVVHASAFAAYAGRTLVQRLGIKPRAHVALMAAPADFKDALAPLPEGVRLTTGIGASPDLVLWFVRRPADLERTLPKMGRSLGEAHVWIAWPKGGSAAKGELTQQVVRKQGLAAGLVDYKICSIDATWSALLFRRRSKPRQTRS